MTDFKNKNDYSVSVFSDTGFLVKSQFVGNLYAFTKWLDSSLNYSNWSYINVYARRSGTYIGRFYKGSFIPPKPRY